MASHLTIRKTGTIAAVFRITGLVSFVQRSFQP
jgi:hypothetical protein